MLIFFFYFLDEDRSEFVKAYNKFEHRDSLKGRIPSVGSNSLTKYDHKKHRGSRSGSKSSEINPELIKTAAYIKHLFMVRFEGHIAFGSFVRLFAGSFVTITKTHLFKYVENFTPNN